MTFVVIAAGCGNGAVKTDKPALITAVVAPAAVSVPGSDSDTASDTDASACHLLSADAVTTAMRQPMKVVGGAGAEVCAYAAAADPSIVLEIQTFPTHAAAAVYTQLEARSEHVPGLSDDAFWNPTLDMIFVQRGDRCFILTAPSLANLAGYPQASKAAMVKLASTVLVNF